MNQDDKEVWYTGLLALFILGDWWLVAHPPVLVGGLSPETGAALVWGVATIGTMMLVGWLVARLVFGVGFFALVDRLSDGRGGDQ
jgi:hypothetical protein